VEARPLIKRLLVTVLPCLLTSLVVSVTNSMERMGSTSWLPIILLLAHGTFAFPQSASLWEPIPQPREDTAPSSSNSRDANRIGPAGRHGLWVTSQRGPTWLTQDDGRTWLQNKYPQDVVDEGGLAFIDGQHAWAAGAVRAGGPWLASTQNGGQTWRTVSTMPDARPGGFQDVQFLDGKFGIAVGVADSDEGGRSLIAVTHDGGASWKNQVFEKDQPDSVLLRVYIVSQSVAWAVGGASIYCTHDGGASWKIAYKELGLARFSSIAMINSSEIFVTGGWGLVLRSRDSGVTWEKLKLPPGIEGRYLDSVCFSDALHGWIGGDRGTIIATADGGATWHEERTGVKGLIRDMAVLGNSVYAVGDTFFLLRRKL